MQALKLDGKWVALRKVDVPKLTNPKEVLIKVAVTGVCGTDLHILDGDFDAAPGVILGHEVVGVVQEVGSKCKTLKVGDRIAVNPHGNCGKCFYCTRELPHFCMKKALDSALGIKRDGGFASYCIAPAVSCHRLPDSLSFEHGVYIEPYSCILHAVSRGEPIQEDCKVLVLGAGIIGLLATIYFSHRKIKSISVCELIDERINTVKNLKLKGVSVIHPDELKEEIAKNAEDPSWGFDRAFDFTGAVPAIQTGFDALRKRGRLILFGIMRKDAKLDLKPSDILYKEITITAALTNPGTIKPALDAIVSLSSQGILDMDKLNMKSYRLEQYDDALKSLKNGSISKAMFNLSDL